MHSEIKYWIFRFLLFTFLGVFSQEGKEARDVKAKINLFQNDIFVQIDAETLGDKVMKAAEDVDSGSLAMPTATEGFKGLLPARNK